MVRRRGGAPLRLRRATLADAALLARVRRASVRGLASGAYSSRQIALWSRLGAVYDRWTLGPGGERAFVAERSGRAAGWAAFTLGPPAELTALFVRPAEAGRGVGTALLARVEAEARRRGAGRLVVQASLNGAAFYRARGFRGTRRIRVPLPDGEGLEAIRMSKRLGRDGSL
ncbi:GNAT family N-acetyltransferase [Anaeromyxobacter oryzae]|uniref:N-acetyltransferase domain-containing protein n=1 Tax=Anaeromyxobacter oryzae TaxID=2918170 RepID=A0ABM7WVV0_9BACT|nr:GNAT family N-acetyltransferase [Anaeromyxobacter oryzae]BDG03633.1 hypothetical protein AMOR_26290 [Anaeromyxobacter oryzae]